LTTTRAHAFWVKEESASASNTLDQHRRMGKMLSDRMRVLFTTKVFKDGIATEKELSLVSNDASDAFYNKIELIVEKFLYGKVDLSKFFESSERNYTAWQTFKEKLNKGCLRNESGLLFEVKTTI